MELCVSGAENLKMSMMKGDKDVNLLEKEDIVHKVNEMVKENCKFTTSGLYVKVPKVSRSFLYSIVTKHLDYTVENLCPLGTKTTD